MSNLTQNTEGLENILATVNDLPDAGSGGANVGTCTVNVINSAGAYAINYCYAKLDETGEIMAKEVNNQSAGK